MSKLPKILLAILVWLIFALAVWQIPYPKSLTAANLGQVFAFFTPLFLAISFTIYIFLKPLLLSAIISLGIIFALVLKALDSFNLVTIALILVAEYLLVTSFKNSKGKTGLTKGAGIPKLRSLHRRKR